MLYINSYFEIAGIFMKGGVYRVFSEISCSSTVDGLEVHKRATLATEILCTHKKQYPYNDGIHTLAFIVWTKTVKTFNVLYCVP